MLNKKLFGGLGLVVGIAGVFVWAPAQSEAQVNVLGTPFVEAVMSKIDDSRTETIEPEVPGLAALTKYVYEAMLAWKKPTNTSVDYEAVARDIARVSIENPLPYGVPRTAIQLAGLAFFEGGFLACVDDGRINNGKWRENEHKAGRLWSARASDDGEAWSLWQIHTEKGIVLNDAGEWEHHKGKPEDEGVIHGPMLAHDRRLAVRVALAFLRKSLRLTHGLVGYTGETAETGFGKANARVRFARDYVAKHPYL